MTDDQLPPIVLNRHGKIENLSGEMLINAKDRSYAQYNLLEEGYDLLTDVYYNPNIDMKIYFTTKRLSDGMWHIFVRGEEVNLQVPTEADAENYIAHLLKCVKLIFTGIKPNDKTETKTR